MADYLVRIIAKEVGVRAFVCVTTGLVQEAAQRHETSPAASVALGRALTGVALLGALLKVRQRVALKYEGNGPLQKVLAEADSYGRVRGYVNVPDVDLPLVNGQYDLEAAMGRAGLLTVVKDLRLKEMVESVTQLMVSDLNQDLQAYFEQSEQIATAVQLGEVLDETGQIVAAGGLLIQEMPGQGQAGVIATLQERLQELPPIADLLAEGQSPEAVLALVFAGMAYEVLEQRPLRFSCDCSWQRTRQALALLGAAEVAHLLDTEGEAIVHCHYCHEAYHFNQFELEVLLTELSASA
ncbi:MAG TPA: Hsp33 family molecular chaperone HslO [Chloroflexota bacterium]|nr:Hsp33 family molecular chaperone HslO [Chloroflexota bacterium]